MTHPEEPATDIDQWFENKKKKLFTVNRRKSVRYLRNDIGATVRKIGIFSFVILNANRDVPVKLVDIGSRGVLIVTDKNLPVNKPVILILRFPDFREFEIPGIVVRKAELPKQCYGIKFNQMNDDLAEHLLATQRKLNFK